MFIEFPRASAAPNVYTYLPYETFFPASYYAAALRGCDRPSCALENGNTVGSKIRDSLL